MQENQQATSGAAISAGRRGSASTGSRRRAAVVLLAVTAGYFLVLLDITIVNVALPTVSVGLGAGIAAQQWVIDAYAISLACLLLTGGKLGDLHGNKRVMLGGLLIFGVASLACGLAPSPSVLIGARVLQGVGAAALLPGSLALVAATHRDDPAGQARAIGIWATVGSLAMPAGPLLGGLLVQFAGWRSVFLINIPIIAGSLLLVRVLVTETPGHRGRRHLDPAGAALAATFLVAVGLAVIESGHAGASPLVLACAGAAPVVLAAFVLVERRHPDPAVPITVLRSPGPAAANVVTVLMSLVLLGTIFVLTQYFQVVLGYPAALAGLALTPLFVPLAAFSWLSGRLVPATGGPVVAAGGLLLGLAGMLILTGIGPRVGYLPWTLLALVAVGAGVGLLTPAVVSAAMRHAPPEHTGTASGLNNTARQTGGAIGAAVFGAVAGSPALPSAFVHGLHTVAWLGAGLWAFAVIVALRT